MCWLAVCKEEKKVATEMSSSTRAGVGMAITTTIYKPPPVFGDAEYLNILMPRAVLMRIFQFCRPEAMTKIVFVE